MSAPVYEAAHILERNREHLAYYCANSWQARTLHALRKCRTAALGGHIDRCNNPVCHKLHLSYNSCRNRHCPKCQGHKKEEWIRAREADLLNVPYFHVVFTLPAELNRLCLYEPKLVYSLLFKTAWGIIRDFGGNPKFLGAKMGMIVILHIPIRCAIGTGSGARTCRCIHTCTALFPGEGLPNPTNGNLPKAKESLAAVRHATSSR